VIKQGRLKTRVEQYRQSLAIHGGVMKMCAASLAVRLSRVKIPTRRLRLYLYRKIYGQKYAALDEAELEQPLWMYPSFNALFTRGVRPELRPIPESTHQLLCPCDGTIQDVGRIQDGKLMTVKGIEYTIESLLAGRGVDAFQDGHYAIIFLSPRDCHRIFSPQDGEVEEVLHVPGYRLLVHPPFQKKEYPVFTLNERILLRMTTRLGPCALVLVAGWGVGNIVLARDRKFRPRASKLTRKTYTPPLAVRRGEWLATFELGSTAILLTAASAGVTTNVAAADQVRYGQPVFTFDRGGPRT
jgi:phosphatidylserine decarboxylase